MDPSERSKEQVLELMRRTGLAERIPDALRLLPDVVDLRRDQALLAELGLGVDTAVNELGGSAW